MNTIIIQDVEVNVDEFSGVKSFKDLKDDPRKPFEHLKKDSQKEAYNSLWKAIKPSSSSVDDTHENG